MNILINVSNLHVGGGVQVAASFISELYKLQEYDLSIISSRKVYDNIASGVDVSKFNSFVVCNVEGGKHLSKAQKKLFAGYDLCLTLFGPFYYKPKVAEHICGFAQAWIAYPKNVAYTKLKFTEWFKSKIKFSVQSFFFKKYKHLVVEQQHVKDALIKIGYQSKISVVSNCVSSVYDDEAMWLPLSLDIEQLPETITLGFIGRAYPHKNIAILRSVDDILKSKYQFSCNFVFTFTEEEMQQCHFSELENFYSVGEISINQCPDFYNLIDALVFPSLLECFSASPIEAMKMNTTVIASDYPFVSETCGDAAYYFDPLVAESVADAIYQAFSTPELREAKLLIGNEKAKHLSTARDRAISYLNIIKGIRPNN
ncbi:glycosyltransferase [Vibrio lentus]